MRKYLLLLVTAFSFTACDEKQDPKAAVVELADKKIAAEAVISLQERNFDANMAIKDYFSDIAAMAIALKKNPQKKEQIIKRAGLNSVEKTCKDLLVSKEKWENLMQRCQYRGYFVCAEEIRSYKDAVESLFLSLDAGAQKTFRSSTECPQF